MEKFPVKTNDLYKDTTISISDTDSILDNFHNLSV